MFIDTSIIIELLEGNKSSPRIDKIFKYIKDEPLFVSIIQLAEKSDWCIKYKTDSEKRIRQIKELINIIPLNDTICSQSGEIKHEMRGLGVSKFGLIDGIILASARSINQKLLTSDTDYRKAEDAIVI